MKSLFALLLIALLAPNPVKAQEGDSSIDDRLSQEMQFLESSQEEAPSETIFQVPKERQEHFEQNQQAQNEVAADEKFLQDEVDVGQAAPIKEDAKVEEEADVPAQTPQTRIDKRRLRSR